MPDEEGSPWLASLFAVLEQNPEQDAALHGARQQRLRTASACDLFVSVRKPSQVRELTARFHSQVLPAEYELPHFRSLEVHREQEIDSGVAWTKITIRAPQKAFNDLFTSLAEDISRVVGSPTEESEAALILQRRLYQWQRLLQKTGVSGLTEEQQQGLYGELWCLREIILPALSASSAITAWTGPEATDRDFQFLGSIALEVKTTRSSSTPMLSISSERQLDDTGLTALYLLHLALEKLSGTGETLPQLVVALRSLFGADPLAYALFEDKLLDAGYLETHSARYRNAGYTLHGVYFYRVEQGFPRITPHELLPGVGSVRYAVSAAACRPFAADLRTFAAQLGASQ